MPKKVEKTEEQWRADLGRDAYAVLREKGTEPAFTGEYHDCKDAGVYSCAACSTPLFRSTAKYDSGTGWPSFFEPIDADSVAEAADQSHGMARTEAVCGSCGGHLGHVFPDGPAPSGQRYCMNSLSLRLDRDKNPESDPS